MQEKMPLQFEKGKHALQSLINCAMLIFIQGRKTYRHKRDVVREQFTNVALLLR
jgi:hypothetical protein